VDIVCVHSKDEIEAFARRNPFLHLYEIGDLDDFFWPHTTWYALQADGRIRQLVLLYTDLSMPIVLANAAEPVGSMHDLLVALLPWLPKRFYGHLSPEVVAAFTDVYRVQAHGIHLKMGLQNTSRLAKFEPSAAVKLASMDVEDVQTLFRASYPVNWFVPRMLETGFYYGLRDGSKLVSVAGVHVYSERYRVAALGNITTHPDFRGRGLGTKLVAQLCLELTRAGVERIGLNVKADNAAAIACYEKVGFEQVARYGEYTLQL